MSKGIRLGARSVPGIVEAIKDRYAYDPETGIVSCRRTGVRRGWDVTRNKGSLEYRMIQVKAGGKRYGFMEHQVAVVLMLGELPAKGLEVDHINRNGRDNRWSNLRVVTRKVNANNTGAQRCSTNKYKFVGLRQAKYKANPWQVIVRGRYVGVAPTLKDAVSKRNRYLVENNLEMADV